MECPNCKKQLADNAKSCPECGYDFTELQTQKQVGQGCLILIGLIAIIVIIVAVCLNFLLSDTNEVTNTQKWTQEEVKEADDYITTLEATGLVKERKSICDDGTKGCYSFVINESLWNNETNYNIKKQLITASEIYASSNKPYKFFKGIGDKSGKTLYDIWGIKN